MRNLWKYSFWALLFVVCGIFLTLFQIGILKVDFPSSQYSSTVDLKRRSVTEEDGGKDGESSFPANVVGGSVNDNDRFEREYEYNTSTDNDDDDVRIEDDTSSSADGGSADDENDNEESENKDEKKDEENETEKDSKKDGSKKDDKNNVLSEDELLKYHSKAVNKIWAPNIERNLVYVAIICY